MSSDNQTGTKAARLEEGAFLPESANRLVEAAGFDFCDVYGFGVLRDVELEGKDPDQPVILNGELDLLDLKGRVRRAGDVDVADYVCTLSRHTDNGIQVLGGVLKRARVEYVELTLCPLMLEEVEGLEAVRETRGNPEQSTQKHQIPKPVVQKPKKPEATKWAEVISESQKLERTAPSTGWEEEEVVVPARGDVVNHRQFGRCDVVKLTDEHIALRKPDGRTVQLGLSVLAFQVAGSEGSKTIFDVSVKRH